jgi:phosphoribosylglycinamide formyltransferase-1
MSVRRKLALGVLASGTGSNFEAIARACERGELAAEIRVVICNREGAAVLGKAAAHGIETVVVPHADYPDRNAFDAVVAAELARRGVELVVMAGFDRVVTATLLSRFPQRVINIHPSLLPAFRGMNAQRQALEYGARIAGATVHLVDEAVDHGPILVQAAVPVLSGDDAEALRVRILAQEHRIYPQAIQLFAEGRVRVEGRRAIISTGATTQETSAIVSPATTSDEKR